MKIFKWLKNLFIIGFIGVIILLIIGLTYEKLSKYSDSRNYKYPGKIVEINNHKMHLYAEGNGDITVVFASGLGTPCPYIDFYPLYSEISKYTRIAVYDRPGYGWSEVTNSPRNIDTIAQELHELLDESGEKPPYILVGHSIASLEIIRFAQLYKDEVKGIVTIDAGNPEFYANNDIGGNSASSFKLSSMLNKLGIIRLLFNNSPNFYSAAYSPRNNLKFIPETLISLDKAMYLKNMANKNVIAENNNIKINAATVVNGGKLQTIPLRILTSEKESTNEAWKLSQESFKDWSSDSTQEVIKDVSHYIHQYNPNVVNATILSLLNEN